jgi:hypothetical protein
VLLKSGKHTFALSARRKGKGKGVAKINGVSMIVQISPEFL